MPPSDATVGTITLRGPHDKLGIALNVVYDKANSVRSSDVVAPYWLHRYIIGKKGQKIKEITQNLPKVHVEFTEKEDKIRIEGPPDEVSTCLLEDFYYTKILCIISDGKGSRTNTSHSTRPDAKHVFC